MSANGFCSCGCGGRTRISKTTCASRGILAGSPVRFIHGHNTRRPLEDRFWQYVEPEPTSGHWFWIGYRTPLGYGRLMVKTPTGVRPVGAHRIAYELYVGPIPSNRELDHKCRMPMCVNPAHLESVTDQINVLRGKSPAAALAQRTHCNRGHPFDAANTSRSKGYRRCRICHRTFERERNRRARAAP